VLFVAFASASLYSPLLPLCDFGRVLVYVCVRCHFRLVYCASACDEGNALQSGQIIPLAHYRIVLVPVVFVLAAVQPLCRAAAMIVSGDSILVGACSGIFVAVVFRVRFGPLFRFIHERGHEPDRGTLRPTKPLTRAAARTSRLFVRAYTHIC